jgi:cardiolipin synthase
VSLLGSLPNIITLIRLLAVPLMVWLVLADEMAIAFWVFIAAGVSDGVDGYLAKRLDAITELGTYLDPLADKAMLAAIFVTLGYTGGVAVWLVILIVFRDIMIVGGVLLGHTLDLKMRVAPLYISKVNTVVQIVLAAFLLAKPGIGLEDYGLTGVLVYIVAATTVVSSIFYLVRLLVSFDESVGRDIGGDAGEEGV